MWKSALIPRWLSIKYILSIPTVLLSFTYICLVGAGGGCLRPHGDCDGPFVIQPRPGICSDISGSGVTSQELNACVKLCIRERCCMAGAVWNKECVLSYLPDTEGEMHFVKNTPNGENCMNGE